MFFEARDTEVRLTRALAQARDAEAQLTLALDELDHLEGRLASVSRRVYSLELGATETFDRVDDLEQWQWRQSGWREW